jgi:putative membrane protein insertion efficiency factor
MLQKAVLALLTFYQLFISPLKAPSCRFYPSCSIYAYEAVVKNGVARGLLMTAFRLGRCHPFHPGGYDPV